MKMSRNFVHLFAAALAFSTSGCQVPHQEISRTIDRPKPMENAELWRQVAHNPAKYVPRQLAAGSPTGPAQGKWIVDPQDHVAFFVPGSTCGGLSPGVWEGEALKATNPYSKKGQTLRNVRTMILRWPLEAVGNALLAYPYPVAS